MEFHLIKHEGSHQEIIMIYPTKKRAIAARKNLWKKFPEACLEILNPKTKEYL